MKIKYILTTLLCSVATLAIAQTSTIIPPVKIKPSVMKAYNQKRHVVLNNKKSTPIQKQNVIPKQQGISMTQIVDLGLSVKWAGWNLGANSPEQYGGLYGWGDARGMNKSTDPNQYPSQNPPSSISGTQYDTARNLWGGDWRMPSAYELMELYNECTWQWMTFKGVYGAKVTGPNGNAIFIPAAGYREGFDIGSQGEELIIWSGASDPTDETAAFVIAVGQEEYDDLMDREFFADNRHLGLSIRPVFDSNLPVYELSRKDLENYSTWGDEAEFGDKETFTRADMRRARMFPIFSITSFENGQWGQRKAFNGSFLVVYNKRVDIIKSDNGRVNFIKHYIVSQESYKNNGNTIMRFNVKDEQGNSSTFEFDWERRCAIWSFADESGMIGFILQDN